MIKVKISRRSFEVLSTSADSDIQGRRTQKTMQVRCPFCSAEIKVYVWSLCGNGKLCGCGAKLDGSGEAVKVLEPAPDEGSAE